MDKPILSFTSHSRRLPLIDEVFRSHVANAEACGMHVCLALQDDSVPAMTSYQRSLVDGGKIELLTIPEDHGSNTKWTLCRTKYPDAVMVVVDDDVLYDPVAFRELLAAHEKAPDAFLCRVARKVSWDARGRMVPFVFSTKGAAPNGFVEVPGTLVPGMYIPEHWGGCLYPPGFPETGGSVLVEARARAPHDDDVFTAVLANRSGTRAVLVPRSGPVCDKRWCSHDSPIWKASLSAENRYLYGGPGGRTRITLASFEHDFACARGAAMGFVFPMRPGDVHKRGLQDWVRESGGGVGVEVGSYAGESAWQMLSSGLVTKLFCVDPWAAGWDPADPASASDMRLVERKFDELVGSDPRVVKCKGTLRDFAGTFGDVDFVYEDSDHRYEAVKDTLLFARDVVRPRRAIGGHDYNVDPRKGWQGVRRAVDEVFGLPDVQFADSSWIVRAK